MFAAIDVGSNTVRMLIGECRNDILQPYQYQRKITRLAGGFSSSNELHPDSIRRTLEAIQGFNNTLKEFDIQAIRVVGTAALRRAANSSLFTELVTSETGLNVDIIPGSEEAQLMSFGVLSVVNPLPDAVIIIDIGGGSTEFVCLKKNRIHFQRSYPLGVVKLCEEFDSLDSRLSYIEQTISLFAAELETISDTDEEWQLVGTAGTITTLAAIDLQLAEYDAATINNHCISHHRLSAIHQHLSSLSDEKREAIVGMEPGRGDLILPGLAIILKIIENFHQNQITVSDSGLLEGIILDFSQTK